MMKILIILMLLCTPVLADDDKCRILGDRAEEIMTARQNGTTMDVLMKAVEGRSDILRTMVIQAYKQPRYWTPDHSARAINDFKNKWLLLCYEVVDK